MPFEVSSGGTSVATFFFDEFIRGLSVHLRYKDKNEGGQQTTESQYILNFTSNLTLLF